MTIADLVKQSNISKNEAVLLISHLIKKPKEFIIAHDDKLLKRSQYRKIEKLFLKRHRGVPLAQLTGQKEFYSRSFKVNNKVLIPRPETETIIEEVKKLTNKHTKIIDVGTGSGCIAITLKLEQPHLDVTASDINNKALAVAKKNATLLKTSIKFSKSDLLNKIPKYTTYDIIIANLPYVSKDWQTGPEIKFEPDSALFSKDNGLDTTKRLIRQANKHLEPGGFLVLELDPCQHEGIIVFAKKFNFSKYKINDYILVLKSNRKQADNL